ncbi:hypothetical protein Xvie_03792 [Xenorhabdus vietnamensis]|uniref:DUF3969 family protein n=1 Tax=Xenorhabdus vietnamensis TaxID=351656 RepID=A0A1Y2SA03_9GAMM|nr:DUF3969 family protein [Xenorhabdus vietnamensis]OTA14331.1 hypothetical protein Xvie_03792 [Xenorhabdus vietnamensis]
MRNMRLNYNIQDKHAEKFISFLILGVLHSLDKGLISIEEAEGFIFMPSTCAPLKEIKASDALIDIIETGCQLEDVESLLPEKLSECVNKMIEDTLSVIKNNKEIGRLVKKRIKVIG